MRLLACSLFVCLALLPRIAHVQAVPERQVVPVPAPARAQGELEQRPIVLPDLGDAGAAELSPQMERKVGESIMRDIRLRDPGYLDDAEVNEYLNALGARLLAAAPGGRQDFEFFVMRDSAINAFALPGGYIGVNTGLISAADSESELASVLAHEIAHVTQRHLARQLGLHRQMQTPLMIAMAAALLLSRARPDLAAGASAAVQGGAVHSQLSFSRDFEREADRIGFQTLAAAGFDTQAMGAFFEKMQRSSRLVEGSGVPSYMRSHPVTSERIAEAQNRAEGRPNRPRADSVEYHLVRARLRAEALDPQEALRHFADLLADRRYAHEPGARYGLAVAYLRAKDPARAATEIARLQADGVASPLLATLAARVRLAQNDPQAALAVLEVALARHPHRRSILYAMLESLQDLGRFDSVLAALAEPLRLYPHDAKLHAARARAYAGQGRRLLQHQAQAEVYVLQGSLPAAIEQLQLARSAGDGNFYELSVVEARLKQLRADHAAELHDLRRR